MSVLVIWAGDYIFHLFEDSCEELFFNLYFQREGAHACRCRNSLCDAAGCRAGEHPLAPTRLLLLWDLPSPSSAPSTTALWQGAGQGAEGIASWSQGDPGVLGSGERCCKHSSRNQFSAAGRWEQAQLWQEEIPNKVCRLLLAPQEIAACSAEVKVSHYNKSILLYSNCIQIFMPDLWAANMLTIRGKAKAV